MKTFELKNCTSESLTIDCRYTGRRVPPDLKAVARKDAEGNLQVGIYLHTCDIVAEQTGYDPKTDTLRVGYQPSPMARMRMQHIEYYNVPDTIKSINVFDAYRNRPPKKRGNN